MVRVESDCVDCDLPCIYEACPYYQMFVYECDDCGEEVDNLYYYDGQELCIDCIEHRLERVEYCG